MTEFTKEWIEEQQKVFQEYSRHRWAKYIQLQALDEIQRLQSKLSAYENDLVLLDVSDKLKKAEARIVELEVQLVEHNQKMIDIGTNRFGRGK